MRGRARIHLETFWLALNEHIDQRPTNLASSPCNLNGSIPRIGPVDIVGQPINADSIWRRQVLADHRPNIGQIGHIHPLDDISVDIRIENQLLLVVEVDIDHILHVVLDGKRYIPASVFVVKVDLNQRALRAYQQKGAGR